MNIIQGAVQALTKNAVELAPESWLPGGKPDPLSERTGGQIGTPISRLDGPLKVKGAARFAAEFPMEVMVYVALAFSAIPKERIVELDTSAAEGALGVLLVMTHKNAPSMKPTPVFLTAEKAAGGDDLPIMQDDRVHRNGQPIAVVLGETQEQADHAASLICATYEAEEATTSFEAAKAQGTEPGVFQGEPLQIIIRRSRSRAGSCAVQVDATYRTPRHNHNAIELHAATLAWNGDELTIHDASQGVVHTAWTIAQGLEVVKKVCAPV